ncbi:hypothetical protein ABE504_28455 [Paenibacillus oryzisoli]|uniref:hypothetical protein n=1 Tax=Paenibacillus oryzisoli TaxID=1850517 RepID=UPI003D29803C
MGSVFISKPAQLEEKLKQWRCNAPDNLRVDAEMAYTSHNVYAITITDFTVPDDRKSKLYVAQPHAHEPATTAGMIDVIEQLLTGKDLAGRPTSLDVEKVLATTVLTFNAIGNPGGTERSPYPYWDGSNVSNERFRCIMFGEDRATPLKIWNRVDKFDIREVEAPDPIGIAYEQIDSYTYVEPNRSPLSSYSRLFRRMHQVYNYRYWLDLHQTEFDGAPTQCQILLPNPSLQETIMQAEQQRWADQISDDWREAGFRVAPPMPSGYTGAQADYFRKTWGDVYKVMHKIVIEVKNNAADMPPERQMAAEASAILTTIRKLSE